MVQSSTFNDRYGFCAVFTAMAISWRAQNLAPSYPMYPIPTHFELVLGAVFRSKGFHLKSNSSTHDSFNILIIYFPARKIEIECDPEYDPDTFIKTVRTFSIIKKSSGRCDLTASGNREAPPNFQGTFNGYPLEHRLDIPCPSDPCRTF